MKILMIREGLDFVVIKMEPETTVDQWILARLADKGIASEFLVCPDPHNNVKER